MKISIEATQKELVELVNALQNQQLKGADAKKLRRLFVVLFKQFQIKPLQQ